ncbi:Rpn family recombination-promoting nuclease/putative transposase [Orientia tsutsugamushi]|uniref:Rpn family recombination-promoting nuclease/putative transposase n=1 Tax=Orientia tsutsugamushi TaxID=784 RepID=UPI0002D35B54|nr:Rpn family recombination-promoting nuclease/putative transposase [Orientia tsutsugamushi]
MSENLKHDGLFKDLMNEPKAALDFINDFLPNEVKNVLDLNTRPLSKLVKVVQNYKCQRSN